MFQEVIREARQEGGEEKKTAVTDAVGGVVEEGEKGWDKEVPGGFNYIFLE